MSNSIATFCKWHLIVLVLQFVCIKSFAQKESPVIQRVAFNYESGGNDWGVPGIYSRGERITLSLMTTGDLELTQFLAITRVLETDGTTRRSDTTDYTKESHRIINKVIVDSLITTLKQSSDNYNYDYIRSRLKSPSKDQILQLAKDGDLHSKFEDRDADELQEIFEKIKSFDKLDAFIKINKPQESLETFTSDAWDSMILSFVLKSNMLIYRTDFFNILGQPFWLKSNVPSEKGVVNLKINELLTAILPKESLLYRRLDLNSLTADYIRWYLEKVL